MLRRFLSLLGIARKKSPTTKSQKTSRSEPSRQELRRAQAPVEQPQPDATPMAAPAEEPENRELSIEARDFIIGLSTTKVPCDLQDLPPDDRYFLSELMRNLREDTLEVPVLPKTATEISRLMADPFSKMTQYVNVLEADPALSIRVLKVANSAYYGRQAPTNSLRDAVFQIGLNQLRSIVILAHMQGKILQVSSFRQEANWLSEVSLAVATVAQILASELGLAPNVAFTRGILMYLDHYLIMGAISDVSRGHKKQILPSTKCLHEAFVRFSARIREITAQKWGLEELLEDDPEKIRIANSYRQIQSAVIANWTGEDQLSPDMEWVSSEKMLETLMKVAPHLPTADNE